jgi:tetratricopeptide (TPR) repeat protein
MNGQPSGCPEVALRSPPGDEEEAMQRRWFSVVGILAICLTMGADPHAPNSQNNDAITAYNNGLDAENEGNYSTAIDDYTQAIGYDGTYEAAYYARGDVYVKTMQFAKAIEDYTQALYLEPTDEAVYVRRALAEDLSDRYGDALRDATKATKMDADDAMAFRQKGEALSDMARYKEAIAAYDASLALDDTSAFTYSSRGEAYLNLCDNALAVPDFSSALRIGGKDKMVFNSRGIAYQRTHQFPSARRDFNSAIAMGAYAPPLVNRGLQEEHFKQYRAALKDYTAAVHLDPQDSYALQDRAILYEHLKRYKDALADINKAIAVSPLRYKLYGIRADILGKMGVKATADRQIAKKGASSSAKECSSGL